MPRHPKKFCASPSHPLTLFDTPHLLFRLDTLSKPHTTLTPVPQLPSVAEYLGSTGYGPSPHSRNPKITKALTENSQKYYYTTRSFPHLTRLHLSQNAPRITTRDHLRQITTLPHFHPAKASFKPVSNLISRIFQQKPRRRSLYTTRSFPHVTRLYPLQDTPRITPKNHPRKITTLPSFHPAKLPLRPVSNSVSPQDSTENRRKYRHKTRSSPPFTRLYPLQDTPRITPRTHLRLITTLSHFHPAKPSLKPVSNSVSPQISTENPQKIILQYPQFSTLYPPLPASRHPKNHPKDPPAFDNDTAKLPPGKTTVETRF